MYALILTTGLLGLLLNAIFVRGRAPRAALASVAARGARHDGRAPALAASAGSR